MKITRQIGSILGLATALGLVACGGGSSNGSSGNNTPPPAGPTPVTAVGSITGFGSVFVHGTKFEVAADTVVAIEDEADTLGDDSRLRVGMKVRVAAIDDNGVRTARRIEFDEDLKGPIEIVTPDSPDSTTGTIVVVRTLVTIDSGTAFDNDIGNNDGISGIDIRDLAAGMVVEISGFPMATGYLATRVDRLLDASGGNPVVGDPDVDGDEMELKGIASVADDGSTITVKGVVFDVADNILIDDGFQLGDLDGKFVEVKADLIGGVFVAVHAHFEDDFGDNDDDGEFEIEGILQAVNADNTIMINDMIITVNDTAALEPLLNQRIEIKGTINDAGVLVLREAEPDVEDNVRTEDLVADVGDTSFTTRLGLVITPTGSSRVEDDTRDDGDHLTPAEFLLGLSAGDRIEARANDATGSTTWTRIELREQALDNDDFECELRGPVTSKTGDETSFSFVIQDVTVTTDNASDNDFKGANDEVLGRATFFNNLQPGDVVEAESFEGDAFCMPGALDARQVEFEPDDDS